MATPNRTRKLFVLCCLGFALVLGLSSGAEAYPTSLAFVPTADPLDAASLRLETYSVAQLSPPPAGLLLFATGLTVGAFKGVRTTWHDHRVLALELGLDMAMPTGGSTLILANAKLQLVDEGNSFPAIAVGTMAVSLNSWPGLAFAYAVASKRIELSETKLGRITLGAVRSFSNDMSLPPHCLAKNDCAFRGSFPVSDEANAAILLGYELPTWGPFYMAVDHFGGTSVFGATNVIVAASWKQVSVGVGAWFTHDRRFKVLGRAPVDGAFVGASYTFDFAAAKSRPGVVP